MRQLLFVIGLISALAGALDAGDLYTKDGKYDFFGLARYPEGGKLVEGVEPYEVKEGGGPADQYTRRVVRWWPRKGVDFIEVADGMILRQWTRRPSLLEATAEGLIKKPTIVEHDRLQISPVGTDWYLRRCRGYLHPPEDGNYVFKIAADTMAFFLVSTDETPENLKMLCGLSSYSRPGQWDKHPGQISAPVPMKKGRKYYYEVIHNETTGGDHVQAAWEGDQMVHQILGGPEVSTLDGRHGKVIEERWETSPSAAARPHDLPRTFQAHLIGFDGIGNHRASPHREEDRVLPTVILRMPDGTKRSIDGNKFVKADRDFIMDVYLKEMERVKQSLVKVEFKTQPGNLKAYPVKAGTGKPGRVHAETEHFVVLTPGNEKSHWVATTERAARARDACLSMLEYFHAYLEYGGHLMPYWDRPEQFKFSAHTGEGAAMGGYGGCSVAITDEPGGFAHEYGHGFSLQWPSGETLATAVSEIASGGHGNCQNNIERPYRNCLHGSYVTTLLYRMLGFDPNWGMCAMTAMPKSVAEPTFFHTLARVGQQRGLFKDGIRGMGDTLGDFGARLAEFDTQNQEGLREEWFSVVRNYLEPVDVAKGVYRIPWDEAPEPFGVNIIRLAPDEDAETIEVDFQGYHDPDVYSDWRACIVAVDKDGKARYSDLWNKGTMTMPRREGDLRYWLTVTATPRALFRVLSEIYAPRYPWQVTLRGAVPSRPQRSREDLNDIYCASGTGLWRSGMVQPAIPNTECGRRYIERARPILADIERQMEEAETEIRKVNLMQIVMAIKAAVGAADGAPHPNGGGWVAATAEVAPTAFVGPQAAVLDHCKVLDHAAIEDCAILRNHCVVEGHARVGGQAVLEEGVHLDGYQRCWVPVRRPPDFKLPELTFPTDDYGLLANYAMDQAEAMMLESFYRNEKGSKTFFDNVFNGYLYGKPQFVVDGQRRGFAFDGKTQYAEFNRRAADLGAITVDMAVKWQGHGTQTLLDFGADAENRFTLVTASKRGNPEFRAMVDGKCVAHIASSIPLPRNQWAQVRLEIDGQKSALWIDNKPAGEAASAFRPCDAFKPGLAKRNFIAAPRDGGDKFKGVVDSVVIYTKAHGKGFKNLPEPILNAPRSPEKGFAARVRSQVGMSAYEQRERSAEVTGPMGRYLGIMSSKATVRLSELMHRTPEWAEAVEQARELDAWKKKLEKRLSEEFDASPQARELSAKISAIDEQIPPLKQKLDALRKKKAETEQEAVEPSEDLAKLQEQVEEFDTQIAELRERVEQARKDAKAAVAAMPETKAEEKEIARLREQIKPLEAEAKTRLKQALARDNKKELWDTARKELQYVPLYWRVRASQGVGGREALIEQQLEATDPAYRKWTGMRDRLESLEKQSRYRYETYLLQNTDVELLEYRIDELSREARVVQRELQQMKSKAAEAATSPEEFELQRQLTALEEKKAPLHGKLRELKEEFLEKKRIEAGLPEKQKASQDALSEARDKAMARYWQEDSAIQCMQRSAFHGFYNGPYRHGIGSYAAKVVGESRVRVDFGQVRNMAEHYAPENWKTSVDQWDWRTAWEKQGSLDKLPLTKKWLERVKGN